MSISGTVKPQMPRMFTQGSPGGIQNSYPKKLEQGLGLVSG